MANPGPLAALGPSATPGTTMLAFRAGLVQVCLAGALWGTSGLAAELLHAHTGAPLLLLAAWRVAGAALVLLLALAVVGKGPELAALVRRHPWTVAGAGLCTGVYQGLYFQAVAWAGVTVATVVSLGLGPVVATVVEAVAARRRPSPTSLGVLGCALAGLLLVASAGGATAGGDRPTAGVLTAIAAGGAYGAATLLGRAPAQAGAPLALTTATTAVAALPALGLAVAPVLGGASAWPAHDAAGWAGVAYLAVGTMAVSYLALYAGLRHVPGSAALVATLLEPVTAAAAAAVMLGERIGPTGVAGTVLILTAVAGLSRQAPHRSAPTPKPPPA